MDAISDIDKLKEALERQTEALRLKTEEEMRRRQIEEEKLDEIQKANRMNEEYRRTVQDLWKEVKFGNDLIVRVIVPGIRDQDGKLDLLLEIQRMLVMHMVSVLRREDKSDLDLEEIVKKIDDRGKGLGDDAEDIRVRLRIARRNLEQLENQKAQYGIRVPIDLINEIDRIEKQIEKLESELARQESGDS